MLTQAHAIVAAATLVALVASVMLHGMVVVRLMRCFRDKSLHQAAILVFMVLGLFLAHVVEIWLFGVLSWLLGNLEGGGTITGQSLSGLPDYVYFSAVTYTTLGYGEVYPVGPMRFIFGTEALIGFMLITWSASVTFLQMQRFWR
ncbi:MAG: two pore domain potassium channel family protein [Anaerolineae bacterium]|nr:two pore domain potassium channel family protein [Anaerolineae bacterium]